MHFWLVGANKKDFLVALTNQNAFGFSQMRYRIFDPGTKSI